jgi:type I restriction enzyme S subunit
VQKAIFEQILCFDKDSENWESLTISQCLNYEQPQEYIVKSEHYNDSYPIPVLTANKSFILGYTNETKGIYNKGEAIIFDDFTMDTKFVNFPFKVKSSTIKILTSKNNVDLFLMYCLLNSLNLQPEGHQRSYISIVEQIKIKIPNKEEQIKISKFLKAIEYIVQKENITLNSLKSIKKGLLQTLFI